MLRLFRLFALALLMASWEVAGDALDGKTGNTYFGCHRNVDAACSNPQPGGKKQELRWAVRLHHGKRDYLCGSGTHPQCCLKGQYKILNHGPVKVDTGDIPCCDAGGQS
ncbi:hypothetical protein Pst134EA_022785 [Puccinia striiformis f. sp. tritici]|uniref:Uncharacterized protein n=1 Tax=Puccinia striiformis f. sp. tritici PST-78 TaxID=1165861 RepID=A0A0L0V9N7_9BASI|nr:hypothetical protein Pst134EA_022785 [Puccinia striiformis f. sp. tritici]KAH9445817.1 hypothetical protein Pst134EB_023651 [Puccinia striiformis f. sp. tritici]KAH9455314.1 hypothetical protein Pst134EA_022785 [Puccinia striiformis f. sp. tritici]KNE95709.1 hypothetical protein PSTG_10927 [Puccinia striiformis f. sp. tritici PST-78]